MATADLPDFDALGLELVQLKHRQRDLLRQYELALERIGAFPSEFGRAKGAELASKLDEMSARIEVLEVHLLPVRRHDEI